MNGDEHPELDESSSVLLKTEKMKRMERLLEAARRLRREAELMIDMVKAAEKKGEDPGQ